MHRNTLSRAMAELGLDLGRSARRAQASAAQRTSCIIARRDRSTAKADDSPEDMLTISSTGEARVAIEPGFAWDAQDAYLFDIDGTLLRDPTASTSIPSPPACSG
jgi:hypothetical protein